MSQASTALLIVDVVNDLDFDGGDKLLAPALAMADEVAALRRACRAAGIPTIYANDNFGRWRSEFHETAQQVAGSGQPAARIVQRLMPRPDDYSVLKPRHSAFFATPLEILLDRLGVRRLIVTGLTTDRCVSFTAQDAHIREFDVVVPRDCAASIESEDHEGSIVRLERGLKADVRPWRELDLPALARPSDTAG